MCLIRLPDDLNYFLHLNNFLYRNLHDCLHWNLDYLLHHLLHLSDEGEERWAARAD